MRRLACFLLMAVVLAATPVAPLAAQGTVSAAVRAEVQARAGPYPLVAITLFRPDSALLVFEDSSYSDTARMAGKWMFGPPVSEAEADSCPPEKVLGRRIARVLWRRGGKAAGLKTVIVRVRGTSGLDRLSWTDMFYDPSQLEGPWAGDPERR
jgi:hypothetical protein